MSVAAADSIQWSEMEAAGGGGGRREWTGLELGEPPKAKPLPSKSAASTAKFFFLTGAIFFFFLLNGLTIERLLKGVKGFAPYGWYLTLCQFTIYVGLSWLRLRFWRSTKSFSKTPTRSLALIAFFTVATSGLSNASIGFMNYPTQLMFKSCKVIPVMVAGIFIQSKRYRSMEWFGMILMSIGLIFFTQTDQSLMPNFQLKGIIMVSSALCADAVIGNLQEKVMRQYSISNDELIFRAYTIGIIYILVTLLVKGELWEAWAFSAEHWREVYPLILAFSTTAFFGLQFVLVMIKNFGAVTTVTVTTCRKALTICLSFLLFAKPFSFQYLWSGSLVAAGIYINVCAKKGLPIIPSLPPLLSPFVHRPKAPTISI